MEDFKYKSRFLAQAKVIQVDEELKKEAFASLKNLHGLLPEGLNPEENPDLLYIVSPLVACGIVNANGDCLSKAAALKMYKSFIKKFVDLEHDRSKVVGNIFNVGLVEFQSNRILTEDEAASMDGLFAVAYAAYIWKVLNMKLADFLVMASNEKSKYFNAISSSFEVGFNDYRIAVGDKILSKARILSSEEQPEYEQYLLSRGGHGMDKDGVPVYRVLDNAVGLGAGLVTRPASQVKGVGTVEELIENDPEEESDDTSSDCEMLDEEMSNKLMNCPESGMGYHICDIAMDDGSVINEVRVLNCKILPKFIKSKHIKSISVHKEIVVEAKKDDNFNIQPQNDGVIINTALPMKIEKIEDIASNWSELCKQETSAGALTKFIADEIAKQSEQFSAQIRQKEDLVKTVEAAKAAADAKNLELSEKVTELANRLNEIEQAKATEEIARKFNERMVGLDAEFDLSDEERQIIATEIKDLDDAAFAAYANKCKILMKEKSKAYKVTRASLLKDQLAKHNVSANFDEKTLDLKEVVASVQPIAGQPNLPNSASAGEETLSAKMAKAFAGGIKVDGKEIKTK